MELLDPKNDYVFKRIFTSEPSLLIAFINAVCSDLPTIRQVNVMNAEITPEDIQGKFIVLDILAEDERGNLYNIEMQVNPLREWGERSVYYTARVLAEQIKRGQPYTHIKPVIGIHLLDYDLFELPTQAVWHFQLRDKTQANVSLSDILQIRLIELPKADRLASASNDLQHWITFLEHWQEEKMMQQIDYPPVQRALDVVKSLSTDRQAKHFAFLRERALQDELSFFERAHNQGWQKGKEEGKAEGIEEGKEAERKAIARQLLSTMTDAEIAKITTLSVETIEALRSLAE